MSRKFNCKKLDDYRQYIGFAISDLINPEDDEVTLFLKYCYKRHAFRSDCNSDEYRKIYPELNQRFIMKLKSSGHPWIYTYCETLALKGHLKLGRWMIRSYETLVVPFFAMISTIKAKICGEEI